PHCGGPPAGTRETPRSPAVGRQTVHRAVRGVPRPPGGGGRQRRRGPGPGGVAARLGSARRDAPRVLRPGGGAVGRRAEPPAIRTDPAPPPTRSICSSSRSSPEDPPVVLVAPDETTRPGLRRSGRSGPATPLGRAGRSPLGPDVEAADPLRRLR